MDKTLVKFKDIDCRDDFDYIKAIYSLSPVQTIQLLKEVNAIKLDDNFYRYHSCEYEPTDEVGVLNVVYVYVEGYEDADDLMN